MDSVRKMDSITCQELSIAMVPSIEEDRDLYFSGSALVIDNTIHYAYTGIVYNESIINVFGDEIPKDSRLMTSVQIFGPEFGIMTECPDFSGWTAMIL